MADNTVFLDLVSALQGFRLESSKSATPCMHRKTQTSYLCSTAPAVFSAGAADFVNTHMRYAVVFSVISRPTLNSNASLVWSLLFRNAIRL